MTTISSGGTTITPDLVLGWDAGREARTVVHEVLDGPPAATLRAASPRAGVLRLFFLTPEAAHACASAHAAPAVWLLDDPDVPGGTLRYVVAGGQVRVVSEPPDHRRWVVEVPYQEVAA